MKSQVCCELIIVTDVRRVKGQAEREGSKYPLRQTKAGSPRQKPHTHKE